MKKLVEVRPQLDVAAELAEVKATQVAILARLERLDPTPKLEVREPYLVGSNVYSICDVEARNPLQVVGYRSGRILVIVVPGEPARELPIESVIPWEKCSRADPDTERAYEAMYARMDPKAREFQKGRRKAQLEAATRPFVPPIPAQERYGKTGTFAGGRVIYDE
jgi:hypothetical protein